MPITVGAGWLVGLLLAMVRVGVFSLASPILSGVLPKAGRGAFAIAVAVALARPVTPQPDLPGLLAAGGVNAAVGLVLAFVSGLPFYAFDVAGNIVELGAGLAAAQILDPSGDHTAGVLVNMFRMAALAILLAVGGERILVRGLALSLDAVPLQGLTHLPGGVTGLLVNGVGALMVSGVALAAPILAAIFLADLALAALARFAPQTNAFVIGLPLKLLVALMLLGAVVAIFPGVVDQMLATMAHTMSEVLQILQAR
jgi:flagellar biosynthetic protein FliR